MTKLVLNIAKVFTQFILNDHILKFYLLVTGVNLGVEVINGREISIAQI